MKKMMVVVLVSMVLMACADGLGSPSKSPLNGTCHGGTDCRVGYHCALDSDYGRMHSGYCEIDN